MIKKITITSITAILIILGLIQFPNLFIDNSITYKSFQIYSNKEIILDVPIKNVLDSVSTNLKESQFYQKDQKIELYFVKGSWYERLIGLFGRNNIASSKFDQHIYIGDPNFDKGILGNQEQQYEWVNLVQIITHEGVHSQMYSDYSIFGFMQTPNWINEGYSEYISYSPIRETPEYELSKLFDTYEKTESEWMKTEYGSMTPKQYVRDRILMEYLIDKKQMTIEKIIGENSYDPTQLMGEVSVYFNEI